MDDKSLQDSFSLLETLIDTLPTPVFYKDKQGIYRGCNETFANQIIGVAKEKIVGCSLFDLPDAVPSDLAEIYHQKDLELIENPGAQFYEAIVQCADGLKRDFLFSKSTYTDAKGAVAGMIGVMVDITERKLAEEQLLEKEETLKVITESTNDAIIIMNNRGIITFWNTAASNMLGYSKEEAVGKNLHELIVPERFLNAHLSAFPQFIKTGKGNAVGTTLELYAIGKDHIEIPVELSLSSIMIEGEWFAVGIIRDITARKHAEEQRDRLILDLQKALSEVKTLRGFLPICSHCKKIRDDKGYWNQIESYIHKHTDTEFSHGICPECAEKYFPEMDLYGDDENGG